MHSATTDARGRAAAELRELGHLFVSRRASDALLRSIAQTASGLASALREAPLRERSIDSLKRSLFIRGDQLIALTSSAARKPDSIAPWIHA